MRNLGPITEVLRRFLPQQGTALEVASGPGEHIIEWARVFPSLQWQPSDIDAAALASIRAYRSECELANLLPPIELDLESEFWDLGGGRPGKAFRSRSGQNSGVDADCPALACVVGINVLHISSWRVSVGLLRGGGRCLVPGGHLFVYGPFKRSGQHTAISNAQFDATLRARNAQWGVRDLDELEAVGSTHGLTLREVCEVPSNNLILVFQRA